MITLDTSNPTLIAEERLLNQIWLNPYMLDNPKYSQDLFFHPVCAALAKAFDVLTTNGTPLDRFSLFQEASKHDVNVTLDLIDAVINFSTIPINYIDDIVETLVTAKKSKDSLEHLDCARNLINLNAILTPEVKENIRNELAEAENAICSLEDDSVKKVHDLNSWGELWNSEFEKRKDGKLFYFNEPILDKIVVDGPIPGAGGLIVAQSGMGKTAFVTKIANSCINGDIPCMFFSLEMGAISSFDRLLSTRTGIPYSEIVNPPDPETFEAIKNLMAEERQKLSESKRFRFCEDASISIDDIKKAVVRFQGEIGQKYCIIIIDLLTMVKEFSNGDSMAQKIEVAINKMNALSKELGFHYIGTAQLNRKGEDSSVVDVDDILRFRPTRAQVKNSGALLERCRYTISLFRKKYYINQYFPEDEIAQAEPDRVEVQLLKQNNGETNRMYEDFEGSTFTLLPVLDDEDELLEDSEE